MSKSRAAAISNSPGASKRGGKSSGSKKKARSRSTRSKQGGTSAQKKAAGRRGGRKRSRKRSSWRAPWQTSSISPVETTRDATWWSSRPCAGHGWRWSTTRRRTPLSSGARSSSGWPIPTTGEARVGAVARGQRRDHARCTLLCGARRAPTGTRHDGMSRLEESPRAPEARPTHQRSLLHNGRFARGPRSRATDVRPAQKGLARLPCRSRV